MLLEGVLRREFVTAQLQSDLKAIAAQVVEVLHACNNTNTYNEYTVVIMFMYSYVQDVSNWMTCNFLKLNPDKTETIVIATPTLLKNIHHSQFSIPRLFYHHL